MYLLIVVLLLVACAWGMDVHASLYARYGRRTREPRVANRLCETANVVFSMACGSQKRGFFKLWDLWRALF